MRMSGKWHAIEVDVESFKEREVLTNVLPQGDAVLYVQDLEDAASTLGIDVDDIIVSEDEE